MRLTVISPARSKILRPAALAFRPTTPKLAKNPIGNVTLSL